MKFIISFILVLFFLNSNAQSSLFWIEIESEYCFKFKNSFDNPNLNVQVRPKATQDLKIRFSGYVYKNFGVYADFGYIFTTIKKTKPINIFNDFDLNNYHTLDYFISKYPLDMKFSIGLFYRKEIKKWGFSTYIGYGLEGLEERTLSYDLKEKGTNNIYEIKYCWNNRHNSGHFLDFIKTQFQASYFLSRAFNLNFGVSFNGYFTRPSLEYTAKDHFNGYLKRESYTGNRNCAIGLNLGLSYVFDPSKKKKIPKKPNYIKVQNHKVSKIFR